MATISGQGIEGVAERVSADIREAASPTISIARTGEQQHLVGLEIAARSASGEFLSRSCGVRHVPQTNGVVRPHIGPAPCA